MQAQGEFNFDSGYKQDGYAVWASRRQMAVELLARKVGLPLGHRVEVWLRGDVRLRGRLCLAKEDLFLDEQELRHIELSVDGIMFAYREMDSCVRLD